jgi:primosomal protein N' (replication factor Y)
MEHPLVGEGARYAEVAVDAPVGPSRTFSYSIPSPMAVALGQLVWIPFGRRVAQGMVASFASAPQVEATRDILQTVEPPSLLEPDSLSLAKWISRYYRCSLFAAISLFLPPGFAVQVRSVIVPGNLDENSLDVAPPQIHKALSVLAAKQGLPEGEFLKLLGSPGERALGKLLDPGLVRRRVELPRAKIKPRYDSFLLPVLRQDGGSNRSETLCGLSAKQYALLQAVESFGQPYPRTRANKEFGRSVAEALLSKGLLGMEWVRSKSSAAPLPPTPGGAPQPVLNAEQSDALASICKALVNRRQKPQSFLLHGVTGSGKTEVYLRAIQEVVASGRQAILLVPEIALTPQTLQRVNQRFPGRVAVLHSRLTPRQQFDQWWAIREGAFDVVVGPRSALFAPLKRLGLVVIDEEHEWTYKQEEAHPFYHARTVAEELCRLADATLVLGSATPDVETYFHAQQGRHRLLELPHRIGASGHIDGGLAKVEVCDMREELRLGNRGIFSCKLSAALKECVSTGQQAILFLNRRGSAPMVQCRDCGYVATCPRCSISLTYHSLSGNLLCHRCNRKSTTPRQCRQCRGGHIRHLGIGTQRVVDEVRALLPGVRVDRWDADATRSGYKPEEVMRRLNSGETQILVGTQLVAKGLDLPKVTVVGAVVADVGLYLPDFRAGERAFNLLCQVAGRAGRGTVPGRVFVQTYSPEHYAILAAASQDYGEMYRHEVQTRRQLGNPPYNQLMHLVYQDVNASLSQRRATATVRQLRQRAYAQGATDVEVMGPAPGIPSRIRGRYRWHVLVRGQGLHRFLEGVNLPPECIVDVDPVHVL